MMLERSMQVRLGDNYDLCINCLYCKKRKDGKIRCSEGFFDDFAEKDVRYFTPYDFDCHEYEEV